MKLKDSTDITEILYNKIVLDMNGEPNENWLPSEYLLFVKDTSYDGDLNNKLSLIIIDAKNGYVVNNDFKFNSIEITDNKITIYRIEKNKRKEHNYWFKQ